MNERTTFDPGDFRNTVPRFAPENRKANEPIVERVRAIAARVQATPAQVALAWILARKPWMVPIPGTTRLQRLEENLAAASVALSPADLEDLNRATAELTVHGERYGEGSQRMIDR